MQAGKAIIHIKTIGNSTEESINTVGMNLLDVLEQKHTIKVTFGNFLECIDEVCSNRELVWTIYVNHHAINAGIANYIIKDNDTIEIVYE